MICNVFCNYSVAGIRSQNSDLQKNDSSELLSYIEDPSLTKAIECVIHDDLACAISASKNSKNPIYTQSIIEILQIYLNPTSIPLNDMISFLKKYQWIPCNIFLSKVERSINHRTPAFDTLKWFEFAPPITNRGKFFLLYANIIAGKSDLKNISIRNNFRNLWKNTELDSLAEEYIIFQYKDILTIEDLLYKINFLLSNNNKTLSYKLIDILPLKPKALIKAKLDIINTIESSNKYNVTSVNSMMQDDLIRYHYINRLIKEKKYDEAYRKLLNFKPKINTDKWWKLKNIIFRELLNSRKFTLAYNFIQNHNMLQGSCFADAEWLSGWVALEFLNKPLIANKHFNTMFAKTKLANSKSKAAYWIARSYSKNKNTEEAKKWFKHASIYPSTFYGQLAIAKTIGSSKFNYFGNIIPSTKPGTVIQNKESVIKITLLIYHLYKAGQKALAYEIIDSIPSLKFNKQDLDDFARFLNVKGFQSLAVELSKIYANKSFALLREGFPKNINIANGLMPKALYLAIIRQESSFNALAVSPAGARGLMQLMPNTAHRLAKMLGLPFDAYINDPIANVLKGSAYVDELYAKYKCLILTIAAYNAGPGNVNKWISSIGDPRNMTTLDEKIDWIESIPFAETRSYVKKVLENMVIYNYMIDNKHNASTITEFIHL